VLNETMKLVSFDACVIHRFRENDGSHMHRTRSDARCIEYPELVKEKDYRGGPVFSGGPNGKGWPSGVPGVVSWRS
jgi:hypothetical protein